MAIDRKVLYVRLPARLHDLAAAEAKRESRTLAQHVAEILRDRYRTEPNATR